MIGTTQKRPVAIITRPPEDAADLAEQLRDVGADPVLSPVMAIRHLDIEIDLSSVGALAFTSANGVRAFAALTDRRDLPIFAVGPITAAVADAAGFTNIRVGSSDVISLARLIEREWPDHGEGGQILHISGADSAGDLVGALVGAGVTAQRRIGYAAEPVAELAPDAADALRDPDAVAFVFLFSPRSADLFLRQAASAGLTDRLASVCALCLSEAVAAKAQRVRWRQVATSAERTTASMVEHFCALERG